MRNHFSTFFFSVFLVWTLSHPSAAETTSGTVQWRDLATVQNAFGITNCLWDGDSLCFSNNQTFVRFFQGRRKTDVNGAAVWLNIPPNGSVVSGDWRIAAADLDLLRLSILPKEEGTNRPLVVMLDPGHGGEDDGASSKQPPIKEKDFTLAIATNLGARLAGAGFQIVYTRTNDTTVSLDDRSRLARRRKADIFISLHANFAPNPDASGVETYVLTPCGFSGTASGSRTPGWQIGNRNDFHNTLLGFSVHSRLVAVTNAVDRGLKRQSFAVLRETCCPAILVEFGFLSNRDDVQAMLSPTWQDAHAEAVAEGIVAYARKVDTLTKAVAEKRARDEELNERWRLRKAVRNASPATNAVVRASVPAHPSPRIGTPAPSTVSSNTPAAPAEATIRTGSVVPDAPTTNAAPLQLSTLIDLYKKAK